MTVTEVQVPVAGMTCHSCEVLISQELRELPGVVSARAHARRGVVDLTVRRGFRPSQAEAVLAEHGYTWNAKPAWVARTTAVWKDVGWGLAAIALVVVIVQVTGLGDSIARASQGISGVLLPLVLGVAAGLTTCIATVGGLVLAASASYRANHPEASASQVFGLSLRFQVGRILGFTVLGAGLGAIGSVVSLSGTALVVVMVVAGLIMGALGIRLSGVSPRIGSLVPQVPSRWSSRLTGTKTRSGWTAVLLGAATFVVPCGFTQAVQVYAVASADPLQAGLMMGLFAVGTAPSLLALGAAPNLASGSLRERLLRIVGVWVVAFAVLNIVASLTGTMWNVGQRVNDFDNITDNVTIVDGVQYLSVVIDGHDYVPQHSAVYAGMPVVWELEGTWLTCANSLSAPALGIPTEVVIMHGQPQQFTFQLDQPGTEEFACYMAMATGTVTAIPQPEPASS